MPSLDHADKLESDNNGNHIGKRCVEDVGHLYWPLTLLNRPKSEGQTCFFIQHFDLFALLKDVLWGLQFIETEKQLEKPTDAVSNKEVK